MGLLDIASGASTSRGYEYYKDGYVKTWSALSEFVYEGTVRGSGSNNYKVAIDISHPRKSYCSCPHAAGRRIICKHQIALYFSVFPDEADKYCERIAKAEEEEEHYWDELGEKIDAYICSLSKEELQQILSGLLGTLADAESWIFDSFVTEHIDVDEDEDDFEYYEDDT